MSFSTLEADSTYMRSFDADHLNASDYPSIETIKKTIGKEDLKYAIIREWDLENDTTQSTKLDTLAVEFEAEFERALALRQLYYIYFELGGEAFSLNNERAKKFEKLWNDELASWARLKSTTVNKTQYGVVKRG